MAGPGGVTSGGGSRVVGVVAGLVLLPAVIAVGWADAFRDARQVPSEQQLCRGYESLVAAILAESLTAQAARAKRAELLADLAARSPEAPLANSEPVPAAGRRLRVALSYPYATVGDVFAAARPVAVACGMDWRTGEFEALFDSRMSDE